MELNQKIRKFIEANLAVFEDEAQFNDEDNIFQMGFVNSLFAMKLVGFVESEFGIAVDNDDLDIKNFSSVARIISFIESKRGA